MHDAVADQEPEVRSSVAEDRRQASEVLLGLPALTDGSWASDLVSDVIQLQPMVRTSTRPATRCSACWPANRRPRGTQIAGLLGVFDGELLTREELII